MQLQYNTFFPKTVMDTKNTTVYKAAIVIIITSESTSLTANVIAYKMAINHRMLTNLTTLRNGV